LSHVIGLNELSIANGFSVSPNPAINEIVITSKANCVIEITNVLGEVVISQNTFSSKTTVNISNLKEGMYIVSLVNGKDSATTKLIKVN
jgi:hypothetical protein